jgi:2-amino-4-hydroxy-6-hydroxymethyldihydropteridine diphosphokinase
LQLIGSTKSVMIKQSPFYETEPVGYKNQGWFINGAVKIETRLEPFQLLRNIKSVETNFGRDFKQIRFGPRPLDLDILLYDDLVKNTADLVIPHPRMHERCFVLRPLCDIAAEVVHPILKKSIARLLKDLGDCEQKIVLYS